MSEKKKTWWNAFDENKSTYICCGCVRVSVWKRTRANPSVRSIVSAAGGIDKTRATSLIGIKLEKIVRGAQTNAFYLITSFSGLNDQFGIGKT